AFCGRRFYCKWHGGCPLKNALGLNDLMLRVTVIRDSSRCRFGQTWVTASGALLLPFTAVYRTRTEALSSCSGAVAALI
ncbi:MAG: hypothetical protein V4623_03095, partial [Pseudomonadota bacterium]